MHEIDLDGIWRNICRNCVDELQMGGKPDIEEHLEVVKCRSLTVSLVMVLGVRPVYTAAAVCILSVLPTHGTLQYVGINT